MGSDTEPSNSGRAPLGHHCPSHPHLQLCILHLQLRLVKVRLKGTAGYPHGAIGHEQNCEFKLGDEFTCKRNEDTLSHPAHFSDTPEKYTM